MLRDKLNRRIKKQYTPEEIDLFEKYYIYDNYIYQVIRIKKYKKLNGEIYDIEFIPYNSNKIYRKTICKETYLNRKFYGSIKTAKALIMLNSILNK